MSSPAMITIKDMEGVNHSFPSDDVNTLINLWHDETGNHCDLYVTDESEPLLPGATIPDGVTQVFALPLRSTQCFIASRVEETAETDNGTSTKTCFSYSIINDNVSFNYSNSFGACGSGWCSATSASYSSQPCNFQDMVSTPSNEDRIVIPFVKNGVITTEDETDSENDYENNLFRALIDGVTLIEGSENGGCNYYPTGDANLNIETLRDYISDESFDKLNSFNNGV